MNEVSFGLSHLSYNNSSRYLGKDESFTNSSTSLNSAGMVYPFPTTRGSLVFAFGYGKSMDFSSALAFSGFNAPIENTVLYLDSLQQKARVLEGGGINNWTGAAAIEVVKNLFVGLSLTVFSGSYSYNSDYLEKDINNKYTPPRYPSGGIDTWKEYQSKYIVDGEISGYSMKIGLLHIFPHNKGKLGLSIKFPSYLSLKDNYSDDTTFVFHTPDNAGNYTANYRVEGISEYDIASPFVFSIGASWSFGNLMLVGDFDYTDWTQMEFRNTYADLINLNSKIKEDFKPTVNIRLGVELSIPETDLKLRGGFAYLPSPYTFDSEPQAQKYITGGLGYIVEDAVAIDVGYAYGYWNTDHQIYYTTTSDKVTTHNLIATISYRF
jgi:hypothetical protein